MATMQSFANQRTAPRWAGDFLGDDAIIPGGARVDPTLFLPEDAAVATVGVAGAAQGAPAVPVAALTNPIPSGTVLYFGGAKVATLTADAPVGATSLAVAALPTALVSGDAATYRGLLPISVPSGTVLGRTYAERDAHTPYGPAADADDEVFLLVFDITDVTKNADAELYRPSCVVKENYLPVFTSLSSTLKAKLRATYICTVGWE